MQNLPDVMEVEISPSGEWRVPGSEGGWHSVTEDPAEPLTSAQLKLKPEPVQLNGGATGGHCGTPPETFTVHPVHGFIGFQDAAAARALFVRFAHVDTAELGTGADERGCCRTLETLHW